MEGQQGCVTASRLVSVCSEACLVEELCRPLLAGEIANGSPAGGPEEVPLAWLELCQARLADLLPRGVLVAARPRDRKLQARVEAGGSPGQRPIGVREEGYQVQVLV